MNKHRKHRSHIQPGQGRKGPPLDPSKYTELGQFIAARLERLDLRLADIVAKVKNLDRDDYDRVRSVSGGFGSAVLRGRKGLSDSEAERWAVALELEGADRRHFLFLADIQRLMVAASHTRAAERIRERVRYLEEQLADARAARRGLPPIGDEPEVIQPESPSDL